MSGGKEPVDLGKRNLKLHGYLDEPDEGFEQGDCSSSSPQDDASLSPLLRVQKCAQSTDIFDRHLVPRVVQDLFRNAPPDQLTRDLPEIMKVLTKIGEESMLRADLLEHIPNIAVQAVENSTRVTALKDVISNYLIPLVVRNLGCTDTAVDKVAQATLIYLVEKGYVSKLQAEIKVCPAILALSKMESHLDVNFGAVTLMSKLAPLLGRDITERIFLKRFSELCESNMFYVRKISASLLGSFCAVVGEEAFKNSVLPCYTKLCNDDIWGVRKSCAEVIMFVSSVCPTDLRESTLAPIFCKLLKDDCRWVRMSAFQTLGPFISTFANPPLTSLGYNQNGEVVLVNGSGSEFVQPTCSDYFSHASITAEGEVLYNELLWPDDDDLNKHDSTDLDSADTGQNQFDTIPTDENKENEVKSGTVEKSVLIAKERQILLKESKIVYTNNGSNQVTEKRDVEQVNSPNSDCCAGMPPKDNLLSFNEYNYWYISPGNVETLDVELVGNYGELATSQERNDSKTRDLEDLYSAISLVDSETEKSNMETKNNVKCDSNNANSASSNTQLNDQKCDNNGNSNENLANSEVINVESNEQSEVINIESSEQSADISSQKSDTNGNSNETSLVTCKDNIESSVEIEPSREAKESIAQESAAVGTPQTVVPQELVNFFVSMTEPKMALNIDSDMTYHCAYSLPAVVLTLGKENWPILKRTVDLLAGDMQYKVRRTVASSLHELAFILGPQVASEDLTPLFDGFIKDLDEVRIGILTNLATFLGLISMEKRYYFLPKLGEFLRVDNVCNWRFRETLARQLELSVRLFKPAEVVKHIGLFAQALMLDKVSAVKEAALYLVTETIKNISMEHRLSSVYLAVIAERFAHSKKWKPRQTFALLCSLLLKRNAVPLCEFADKVLPHLLDLSWDPVSNVRLVVANCLANQILETDYFLDAENYQQQALENVLRRLQADKDSEVRKTVDQFTTYTFGICKKDAPKE